MDNHTSISSNYFHSLAFSSNFLLDHQVEHEEKPSTLPIIGSTTVSDNLRTHVKYQSQMSKKKRSRFLRIGNSFPITKPTTSNNSGVTKPKCTKKPPDPNAPKVTRPCTECGKQFWSLKALFGHMRCHPERQWRGINPPPNFRRQNDSSFALEFGHDNRGMIMTDEDHEVASSLLLLASGPSTKTDDIGNESLSTATAHDAAADVPSSSHHGLLSEPANVVRDDLHYTPLHGWGRNRINIVDATEPLIKCCRFECSSCKKVFGSHQALGGHRASHKNVKGCHKAALAASASGSGLTTQAVKAHVFNNLDLNFPPPVTLSEGDSSSSYSSSYSGSALDLRLRL